jgi:hypothetical protein
LIKFKGLETLGTIFYDATYEKPCYNSDLITYIEGKKRFKKQRTSNINYVKIIMTKMFGNFINFENNLMIGKSKKILRNGKFEQKPRGNSFMSLYGLRLKTIISRNFGNFGE